MGLVILGIAIENKMRITRLTAPADIFVPCSVRILRLCRRIALGKYSKRCRITHSLGLTALVAVTFGRCERKHLPQAKTKPTVDYVHTSGNALEIRPQDYSVGIGITQSRI